MKGIHLKASQIDTPIGSMVAVGDNDCLYVLEFSDLANIDSEIKRVSKKLNHPVIFGKTDSLRMIEDELTKYFSGTLKIFNTSFNLIGTDFQKKVWNALLKIPFGETRSYKELAESIGQPTSYRAVGNANSVNQLAIIIPCHRVINANGNSGGYAGGVSRKDWFLKHEQKFT